MGSFSASLETTDLQAVAANFAQVFIGRFRSF